MRGRQEDPGTASTENRSSSESGYGTSVGDSRGDSVEDTRQDNRQDTELDEVFYLEEEEEEEFPFKADQSHICVGLSSGQVQYKHL